MRRRFWAGVVFFVLLAALAAGLVLVQFTAYDAFGLKVG